MSAAARATTSTRTSKHQFVLVAGTKAKLISAAALLAILSIAVPSASGCTCLAPDDWGFIGGHSGQLPANADGVAAYAAHYWPDQEFPEPEWRFMVEILEAGGFRPLPVETAPLDEFSTSLYDIFVVGPEGGVLQPGATYRFTMEKTSGTHVARRRTLVDVGRETLSKESDFILSVGPVTTENTFVGSARTCDVELDVSQVIIVGSLVEDAASWGNQLLYRTIVNDEIRWIGKASICQFILPGRSWEEVRHDRIISPCPEQKNPEWSKRHVDIISQLLEQGPHSIMMQAFLPGTGVVLETTAETVVLSCSKS